MYMYNAMGTSCTSRVPEYFRAGCIPIRTRSASRSRHTSSFAVTEANSLPIYLTHQQICLFSLCDCCLMLWNYWTFFWVIVERSHVSINFKPLKSTFLLLHMHAHAEFTSLRGRRSKGKGKGIRARDHARPPSFLARPSRSLAPKTPFHKAPFPFPFKRLPRRLRIHQ